MTKHNIVVPAWSADIKNEYLTDVIGVQADEIATRIEGVSTDISGDNPPIAGGRRVPNVGASVSPLRIVDDNQNSWDD